MGFRDSIARGLNKMAGRISSKEPVQKGVDPAATSLNNPTQNQLPDGASLRPTTIGSFAPNQKVEQSMLNQGMENAEAFNPGRPLNPFLTPGTGPRSYDYPVMYNVQARPRSTEAVSFETLRYLAQNYSIARSCIDAIKAEIRGFNWAIVPDDTVPPETDMHDEIDQVTKFFMYPDRQTPFDQWQAALLDDVLSIDAGCLHKARLRDGSLYALEYVDGATIMPFIDAKGHIPDPGAPGFVQFIKGLPAYWFSRKNLIYNPYNANTTGPYGNPPLASLLLNANTDLRLEMFFLQYFTEGSVPDTYMEAPEGTTPKQLSEYQKYWDESMVGNSARKRQVKWIPGGAKPQPAKDAKFDTGLMEFLIRKTCSSFGVPPEEIGYTMSSNRSTGSSQENVLYRRTLIPISQYLSKIYTRVIREEFHLPLKFAFEYGEREDQLAEAQTRAQYVAMGAISADEVRVSLGLPIDPDHKMPRTVQTNYGPIPVDTIKDMKPYIWVPNKDAGVYQKRGTPSQPMTSVRYEPKLSPDGSPPSFAQRSSQAAQQALDDAEDQTEEQLHKSEDFTERRPAVKTAGGANNQGQQGSQQTQPNAGTGYVSPQAAAAAGIAAVASAALGPPSLNWAEEGLAKAAEHMLRKPQPKGKAWVHPDTRKQSLSTSSDSIFYAIQSFFKSEIGKLMSLLSRQKPASGNNKQTVQQVVGQHDWSTWQGSFVQRVAGQIAGAYTSGQNDTQQALSGKGIKPEPSQGDAAKYAQGRAGELVGMHINDDGSLVPSKNPQMQIGDDTRQALESWLEDELKSGKDWQTIANDLYSSSGEIGFPEMQDWRARRIARTEGSFAYNRGQMQTARDAGVQKVEVLDGVMDDICAAVNGETWTLEQAEADPLGHPNCSRQFLMIIE